MRPFSFVISHCLNRIYSTRFSLYESVKSITVEKLSYGQRRLVALFSSVLSGVSCMLLDEITEGLAEKHVDSVKQILLKNKAERTIIIASHSSRSFLRRNVNSFLVSSQCRKTKAIK